MKVVCLVILIALSLQASESLGTTDVKRKPGLYYTVEEFVRNTPTEPEYPLYVIYNGEGESGTQEYILDEKRKGKMRPFRVGMLYAFCDGESSYWVDDNRILRKMTVGKEFSYYTASGVSEAAVIGAWVAVGVMGGVTAAALTKSHRVLGVVSMRDGSFYVFPDGTMDGYKFEELLMPFPNLRNQYIKEYSSRLREVIPYLKRANEMLVDTVLN